MTWIAFAVVLAGIAAIAIGRNQAKYGSRRAATTELVVDDVGARRVLADGRVEGLDWDELTRVEVVHARRGPHAEAGGVVMLAGDEEKGCLVPMDRIGDSLLLEQLSRQPGFEVDLFVRALQDPDGGDVVCWTRPSSGA